MSENLVTKEKITKPTYEGSVIAGLKQIHEKPYERSIDRHIVMAIPNSLAVTEGTEANSFLKKSGALVKTPEAGVVVKLSQGMTFTSTQTGQEETTLLLDFEYTENINLDLVEKVLLG